MLLVFLCLFTTLIIATVKESLVCAFTSFYVRATLIPDCSDLQVSSFFSSCICGKIAMHITREEHLLSAKFHYQTTGQIWMSVMDPLRKRLNEIHLFLSL